MNKKINQPKIKAKKPDIDLKNINKKPKFVDNVKVVPSPAKVVKPDEMVNKVEIDKKIVKKPYIDKKLESKDVNKKINITKKVDVKKKTDDKKSLKNQDKKSDVKKKLEVNKKVDISKNLDVKMKTGSIDKKDNKTNVLNVNEKLGIYKRLGIAGLLGLDNNINKDIVSLGSVQDDCLKVKKEYPVSDRILDIDKKHEIDKKVDSEKKVDRDIMLQRWLDYSNMGEVVPGTRFRAFKAPLKPTLLKKIPEDKYFTPEMLLEREPKLGIIIDLTSYTRFYDKKFFLKRGIDYAKIYFGGRMVPPDTDLQTFYGVVERFLNSPKSKNLIIGVNCTYGVSRSGYFICRYMIDKLGYDPHEAIDVFQKARGHNIGIRQYVEKLLKKPVSITKSPMSMFNMYTTLPSQKTIDVYEEGYIPTTKKRKSKKSKSQGVVRKSG